MKCPPFLVFLVAAVACTDAKDASGTSTPAPTTQSPATQTPATTPEAPTAAPPSTPTGTPSAAGSAAPPAAAPQTPPATPPATPPVTPPETPEAPDAALPAEADAAIPDAGSVDAAQPTLPTAGSSSPESPVDAGEATPDASAVPDAAAPEEPEPSGACTGAEDQAVFAQAGFDPEAKAPACVVPMALGGGGPGTPGFVPGVAECLSKDTGLSTQCSSCYAVNAECSFSSCGVICLPDRNSRACKDCRCGRSSAVNCFEQLDACTGITSHYCD